MTIPRLDRALRKSRQSAVVISDDLRHYRKAGERIIIWKWEINMNGVRNLGRRKERRASEATK